MEKVYYKKKLVGIYLRLVTTGTSPITHPDAPLQLVTLKHKKGVVLTAHRHKNNRHITGGAETCFIVKKGKVEINLYGNDNVHFKDIVLSHGDIFLTLNGVGHGLTVLADCELYEIKNGPFTEDKELIQTT